MPSSSGTLALWTRASSTRPCVSTSRWRFLPSTFLAGSKPRSFPPTPVVFADWESTIPALGFVSLPSRHRSDTYEALLPTGLSSRKFFHQENRGKVTSPCGSSA
jgi:hypothetical protein